MQRLFKTALLMALMTVSAPVFSQSQEDRHQRTEPGLILETPGRMAACDVVRFVRDGEDLYLLAAGDDKVVIVWQVVDNKLIEKRRLRWGIYREQRGSIYAMTTFRDAEKKLKVVIAGWGRQVGQVAILDFETGRLDEVLPGTVGNDSVVWSLAASPGGERIAWGAGDGTVWVWRPASGKRGTALSGKAGNRVAFVTFLDDHHLLAVGHDGKVLEWDTTRPEQKPRRLFEFDGKEFHGIQKGFLSPNRKWLAVRGNARRIEVRSFPDGGEPRVLKFPEGQMPESLAFDADGRHLAVGISRKDNAAKFLFELNGEVRVFDLRPQQPEQTAQLKMTLFPEELAFDPDGKRLAVAGGNNHELTLWDVAGAERLNVVASPGRCLWKAAFSSDGRFLGVKDHRNSEPGPDSPNDRSTGDYHVFDLGLKTGRRDWAHGGDFAPVEPIPSLRGWKVRIAGVLEWYAVAPNGRSYELVFQAVDDAPRCYTFLKPIGDKPIRLAVGHYWGVSLFEMDPDGKWTEDGKFYRSRVYHGHQGYVTSVAPSADGKLLVTASRDMTVNCWSLLDWPRQAEVGADFEVKGGKLLVKGVDAGSPSWQAGLSEGAEVRLMKRVEIDPKTGKIEIAEPFPGKPDDWKKNFESARPFRQYVFLYKNRGADDWSSALMSARQRPIWRFFPTFKPAGGGKTVPQEWVLWRWQDYFYDTSTNGDQYIGWQISGQAADQPVYHSAEHLRWHFLNPEKVSNTLTKGLTDPEHVLFREIEPPKVKITAAKPAVKDADVQVTVSAEHVGEGALQNLARVEIWVNDRYLATTLTAADFKNGDLLPPKALTIKADELQLGANTIKAIAINKADGRGEDLANVKFESDKPRPRTLYGVFVGINDYSNAQPGIRNLSGAADAKFVRDLWQSQNGLGLYKRLDLREPLLDDKAEPKNILKEIEKLQPLVRPDDQLVLFLAGHGGADPIKIGTQQIKPGTYFFAGPTFTWARKAQTSLSGEQLREALGKLKCHQLIFLDTCHSGDVTSNALQDLRRNGVGALVIAACKNTQLAWDRGDHGLFTLAISEALGKDFKADAKHNGIVEPSDLANYLTQRVPHMLNDLRREARPLEDEELYSAAQEPQVAPPVGELSSYHRELAKKPKTTDAP
jgi:WD40 repeat protein